MGKHFFPKGILPFLMQISNCRCRWPIKKTQLIILLWGFNTNKRLDFEIEHINHKARNQKVE